MLQYIGISGITSGEQAKILLETIDPNGQLPYFEGLPRLMFGVLVSGKTLRGLPDKKSNKYPDINELQEIFLPREHVGNCVHFCADSDDGLEDQLFEALDRCGDNLDAVQLNVTTDSGKIERIKKGCAGLQLIYQVAPHHGDFADMSAQKIASLMKFGYDKHVDKFLIDFSRAKGKQLDPDLARRFIEAFENAGIKASKIAFAGGLSADNCDLIADIINDYPQISIDAETGLRDNAEIAGGFLNMYKAKGYVQASQSIFMSAKKLSDKVLQMDDRRTGKRPIIDPEEFILRDNTLRVDLSCEDESAIESIREEADGLTVRNQPEETDDDPTWADDFDGQK